MHLKRWLTSIVAVPVLVFLILYGPAVLFSALIVAVGAVAAWEYFFIIFEGDKKRIWAPIPVWSTFVGLVVIAAAGIAVAGIDLRADILLFLAWTGFAGIAVLSMRRFCAENSREILDLVAKAVQFLIYIPLPLAALVLLRREPDGVAWVFFIVLIIFLGDAAAFYAGTYLGRRKLHPDISPGKTIEGAIGGLAANLIVAFAFKALFLPELSNLLVALFALVAGAAGQLGDLFESEIKRTAGIKDSGNILPGHGGILDRIDALLFAAPLAYFFKVYLFYIDIY